MILNTKTQKGFSLLELLLVVAVGAILILAGLAIYRNITNNTQINEASRLVNVLKQETQRLYQGEPTYGAAGANLTAILVNAEAAPQRYVNGAAIESPFSAAPVTITAQGTQFDISFANVTQAGCLKLGLEYNDDDNDFSIVNINGTDLGPDGANPVDVAGVNAACVAGPNNTLTWTFE